MSHEDALAALNEAIAADNAPAAPVEQAVEAPPASPPAPEGAPAVDNPSPEGQAGAQGEESGAVEQPNEEEFVPFNPDQLPEELLPAWKQMQAAFTPRLQEAAAIRKQFEELGGMEAVQQAVELQQRIMDPSSWPILYEELYQAMVQAGFDFEDEPGAPTAPQQEFGQGGVFDDPDLAPLHQQLQQLQGQTAQQQMMIEQFVQQQEYQRALAEEELRQAQYLAQMQQQVVNIRQSNPHYTDEDVRAVIELGMAYNDDLMTAQQRYEAIVADRLSRYFEGKKVGAPAAVQPVAGAGVDSIQESEPQSLAEAEAEAIELMRRLQEAGDIDFT
jgi:hypothetical protein